MNITAIRKMVTAIQRVMANIRVPDAYAQNYGYFIQDEIKIKDGFGELLLIPAIRRDIYQSKSKTHLSQDES